MCLFELTLNPLEAPWLSSTPKQFFWALNMDIFKNSFWAVEFSSVHVWRRKTEFHQLGNMLLEKQVGRADLLILITWHVLHACHFTCIYIESNGESMNIVRSDLLVHFGSSVLCYDGQCVLGVKHISLPAMHSSLTMFTKCFSVFFNMLVWNEWKMKWMKNSVCKNTQVCVD